MRRIPENICGKTKIYLRKYVYVFPQIFSAGAFFAYKERNSFRAFPPLAVGLSVNKLLPSFAKKNSHCLHFRSILPLALLATELLRRRSNP